MTTTDPREPSGETAPQLAACNDLYRTLLKALHAAGRADAELSSLAAFVAIIDLAGDLVLASGLLWASPDLVSALRSLADTLERRRKAEPAQPLLPTVREFFASARPPLAN
jgi:hypothetical protein